MASKRVTKRRRYSVRRKIVARAKKMTIPLAAVAGFLPVLSWGITDFKAGGAKGLLKTAECLIPWNFSGTNKNADGSDAGFYSYKLKYGLYPIVAGLAIHKLAGYLGINKMLARAGIPFIRV